MARLSDIAQRLKFRKRKRVSMYEVAQTDFNYPCKFKPQTAVLSGRSTYENGCDFKPRLHTG